MDERDLYVPEDAGKAELHPLYNEPADLDEFDPLVQHHTLEIVPEQKPVDFAHHDLDLDEGQHPSKPKQDDSEKTDIVDTPVDNAGEDIIQVQRHSPLTVNSQQDYNEIGK
jgi:hypothetical protein